MAVGPTQLLRWRWRDMTIAVLGHPVIQVYVT